MTKPDFKAPVKAEQEGMSKEEIADLMRQRSDFLVDMDNIRPQKHRWMDRGQVMSCEGGDHPPHRAFKRITA